MAFIEKPGLILIGATGRNSGKTLLACTLIERFASLAPIVAIKVTTIHENGSKCPKGGGGCGVCSSLVENFSISEEKNKSSGKDTSLLLKSGARKVFWLRVLKNFLREGLEAVFELIPEGSLLVCESNSARTVVEPGVFLMVGDWNREKMKPSAKNVQHLAHRIIRFERGNPRPFDFDLNELTIVNRRWALAKS